ncbi:MAG: hypothetical protein BMS9Abin20_1527 [Acidimicrobiia bacterium]|nr:MAG: hypothetical protein BMS9Abin20_1527 [Acidimicrobiia bacterium]
MNDENDEYLDEPVASNRRIVGLIVTVVVIAVAGIFIFQNTDDTSVEFLFLSGRAPLYLVIVVSMILGALLGWIGSAIRRRRKRRIAHEAS